MSELPISTAAGDQATIGPTHPLYAIWAPVWRALAHVYEGSGGFLDGGYIIPHPREWEDHSVPIYQHDANSDGSTTSGGVKIAGYQPNPNPSKPTAKLKERRRIARYENVASTIVDQKVAALFRQPPVRKVKGGGEHPWLTWCENVDGDGLALTDYLHDAETIAMVFGHAPIVLDRKPSDEPVRTQADVLRNQPYLRTYTPLDMPDWITTDTGCLTQVKLIEYVGRTDLLTSASTIETQRVRFLTETEFIVMDESNTPSGRMRRKPVDRGEHKMGKLPVVMLYANKRALIRVIGKSVLFDPQLFIDHYNLTSELRELFRKQAFSILNVPLGTGDAAMDVEKAKELIGASVGTANVLFSAAPIDYVSPDQGNVTSYQAEIARLLRTIFRLAGVPWESDSKDAESEGSMKLKREDMNQLIASYADKLERAEYQIMELWFRAMYGADNWQRERDAVEPSIVYTRTFDVTPFADMLEQAQAALALPLGQSKTFLFELALSLLAQFLPNLDDAQRRAIVTELKNLPDPQQERAQRLVQLTTAFAKTPEAGAQQAARDQSGMMPGDGTGAAAMPANMPGQKAAA